MTIRYRLTRDDYIRFNLHHYDTTQSMQKAVRSLRLAVPGMLVLIGLLLSRGRINFFLIAMLVLAAVWVWFLPWHVRRTVARGITRQVQSGHYDDLIGEHELTLTETGLRRTDPGGGADYAFADIQKIGNDEGGIYLYVDTATAVIVPLSAFADEAQRRDFEERVRAGMQRARQIDG